MWQHSIGGTFAVDGTPRGISVFWVVNVFGHYSFFPPKLGSVFGWIFNYDKIGYHIKTRRKTFYNDGSAVML
jgi:hypothetical protein